MSQTPASPARRIHSAEMIGIVKRFPGVLANNQVDFDVRAGEIHALLGENGAGKSTLVRQLYGLYRPDAGKILINGQEHSFSSPLDAIEAGIGMIHQHFMLAPSLSVVENVALGLKSSRGFVLDLDRVEARLMQLCARYGMKINPRALVWQLSVGEQQRVEIVKALYRGADLLILDEPTAVLTPQEVDELFKTFHQMAAEGHALIFISHKLREVLSISSRVTVLRDGAVVEACPTAESTRAGLALSMVGRPVILQYERPPFQGGPVCLEVIDLHARGDRTAGGAGEALKGVSFSVHAGEILGLAGVSGNGQRELAECLAGLRPSTHGQVLLNQKDISHASPGARILAGQAYIPEERMREGAIKDFSVADNIILEDHPRAPYSKGLFLNFKQIQLRARQMVDAFQVKTPSLDTPLKNLSGGNIQKLILARELARKPKALIASQPTRGVDIGASEYIHLRLLEQRQAGAATLLISEDLDEICALADRIAVMYEGQIMGILDGRQATPERLGLLMAGVQEG